MSETLEESILNLLHRGQSGTQINCFRCGVCCRYGVSMGSEEADVISKSLSKPLGAFLEGFSNNFWTSYGEIESNTSLYAEINWIDELENYRTKRNNGGCIFLQSYPETYEVRCSIHNVRPPACRGYAPNLDREACQTGLRKMWGINVTSGLTIEGNKEKLKAFYDFLKAVVV